MPDFLSKDEPVSEPHLAQRWGTRRGLGHKSEKILVDPKTLTPDNVQNIMTENTAKEQQDKRDDVFFYVFHIMSEFQIGGGRFDYPVPSVSELIEKASKFTSKELKQEIAITSELIEKSNEARNSPMLNHTEDQLNELVWNRKPLEFKLPNGIRSWYLNTLDDAAERLGYEKEACEILDLAIAYQRAVKAGYEGLLKEITETAPAIVKTNLVKMDELRRAAQKSKAIMIQLAREYRKKDKIDPKKAHEYAIAREVFFTAESQFLPLDREISGLTDRSSLNIPKFPPSLTPEERKGEESIMLTAGLYRPKKPKKTIHLKSTTDEKGHRDRERYLETKRISAKIDEERKRLPPVKDAIPDSTVEDLCKAFDEAGKAVAKGDLEALKKNRLFKKR